MSIVAPSRRTWLLPAGASLVVALVASVVLFLLWNHSRTSSTSHEPFTVAPAEQQAHWNVKSFPAGALAKIGKSDRALVAQRASVVEDIVKDVYDAQLLKPSELPKVLHRSFTAPAAKSFEKSGLGIPRGAADIRSTKRAARIGVNVAGARSAAAKVTIEVVGELKGEQLRIAQHSTLWMQKLDGGWRVVGYDVSQGPTPAHRKSGHDHKHGGKKAHK